MAKNVKLVTVSNNFGEPKYFDAIVNGIFPNGKMCLWIRQEAEIYEGIKLLAPTAYVAIPSADDAEDVISQISVNYHLSKFRQDDKIKVSLCGENVSGDWEI